MHKHLTPQLKIFADASITWVDNRSALFPDVVSRRSCDRNVGDRPGRWLAQTRIGRRERTL